MDTPRIGVVGMGGFAQTHRRYVAQVEEAGLGRQVAQVAIPADQELFGADLAALQAGDVRVFASLPLALTRSQTLCACGTFESSPIRELPAALRRVDPQNQAIAVQGMGEALQRACQERALFSELGISWAQAGEEISLEGYSYFPSFRS